MPKKKKRKKIKSRKKKKNKSRKTSPSDNKELIYRTKSEWIKKALINK